MRALTLHRPWPAAIMHCGKRVENRCWRPPHSIVGQDIAIHAGKTIDTDTAEDLLEEWDVDETMVPGPLGIVAIVRLLGYVDDGSESGRRVRYGINEDWALAALRSEWFIGPVGWVLGDVRPLASPVPCRGAQGLWSVPPDASASALAAIRRDAPRDDAPNGQGIYP